jgi:hypothetical protein
LAGKSLKRREDFVTRLAHINAASYIEIHIPRRSKAIDDVIKEEVPIRFNRYTRVNRKSTLYFLTTTPNKRKI